MTHPNCHYCNTNDKVWVARYRHGVPSADLWCRRCNMVFQPGITNYPCPVSPDPDYIGLTIEMKEGPRFELHLSGMRSEDSYAGACLLALTYEQGIAQRIGEVTQNTQLARMVEMLRTAGYYASDPEEALTDLIHHAGG